MSMTHALAAQMLVAYVDGALPLGEAAGVRDHVAECAACSAEVADLQELNQAMAFSPAPPVAFHGFWAGIEKALPRPRRTRVLVVRRTLALAVALAALLVLATAASAFASDRILPDSPLYSFKRVGEDARVALTLARRERIRLQLQLAAERLREARKMAQEHKNQLAVASLQSFQSLLTETSPALKDPASVDRPETLQQIATLQDDLTAVGQAATEQPDESDAQVETIVQDSQASLAQDAQAQPEPSPTPESSPTPEASPTSEASVSSQPQESAVPSQTPTP